MNDLSEIILIPGLIFFIILFFAFCIYQLFYLKKQKIITINTVIYLIALVVGYVSCYFIYGYERAFRIYVTIICLIIPLVMGVIIARKIKWNFTSNKNIQSSEIDDFIQKVFKSEKFYNTLTVSLPKGNDDKEFGLDYIPFILQNIENKRKRFKQYADRFLSATLSLGIIFVVAVFYFGNILLNENESGIGKLVSDLNLNLTKASENIAILTKPDIRKTLEEKYNISIDKISKEISESHIKDRPFVISYLSILDRLKHVMDVNQLMEATNQLRDSIRSHHTDLDKDYKMEDNINNYINQMLVYQFDLNNANKDYIKAINNINSISDKIKNETSNPSVQLNEIIKRLILSVVIISFLITILRYLAKLYTSNYNLMVLSENEDLAIRKFYVALKNTDKNQNERKIVIEKLFEFMKNSPDKDSSESSLSKDESGILKELLNSLMKKL